MKGFRKRIFLIPFGIFLLLPKPQLRSELNPSMKTIVWCLGGTAVVSLISIFLYNTFRTLSDSEELNKAQQLHDKAQGLHLNLSLQHEEEFNYVQNGKSSENELKYSIQRTGVRFPFLHYKLQLERAISSARQMINNITIKKNHLLERKMRLTRASIAEKMSDEERFSYSQQYDLLIDQFVYQQELLQDLCTKLQQLKRIIIKFPEYREEMLLARLNKINYYPTHHCLHTYYQQPHLLSSGQL